MIEKTAGQLKMEQLVKKIELNWVKRISAEKFDDEREFLDKNGGIYIWIFKGTPHRVTYIGETGCYKGRFVQHFSNILAGWFNTYAMTPEDDFVDYLQLYCYDKTINQIEEDKFYIPARPGPDFPFARTFLKENLLKMHRTYLKNLDFAFARMEFEGENVYEKDVRKEIEGILIRNLIKRYSEAAQVPELRSAIKGSPQIPIGRISKNPTRSYCIEHRNDSQIELPEDIIKICGFFKKRIE